MKKLLALLLIPSLLFAAAGDIKVSRKSPSDNAWTSTIYAKQDNGFMAMDATGLPAAPPNFTWTDDTLNLYNTADQTTNYERLSISWATDVVTISSENGGSGTLREFKLGPITLTGALTTNSSAGTPGQVLESQGAGLEPQWATGGAGGDVVGPAGATDNAIVRFDLTTGKLVQDSTLILNDGGKITGPQSNTYIDLSNFTTKISGTNDAYFGQGGKKNFYASGTASVINQDSVDIDFIVNWDSGTALSVDGATGYLTLASTAVTDTLSAGSGSLAGSALDIAQTWNTTGTPTAIKLDVTDTAANSASLLMDLQVGGVSKTSVDSAGNITAIGEIIGSGNYASIYVEGGSASVDMPTAGTFVKLTQFTTDGEDNLSIADAANDQITVDSVGGVYNVSMGVSFSGTNNATITIKVYADGVAVPGLTGTRKLGTGGDVGRFTLTNMAVRLAADADIDVRATGDSNGDDIVAVDMTFSVSKIGL